MLEAILVITLGLVVAALTITRPSFYWESRRARFMRRIIGDRATVVLYLVIALICIGSGIVMLGQ
jgi:uncharacterized membrane protein YecN with MAPEG domain